MADKPTEYTLTWTVTDDMTAKRIGSAGSKILSTPNMVALMEAAALAPTPVGMQVSATARLRSIERRKLWFDIEVNDKKGKCGEGSHLRIMVSQQGMQDKAARKAQPTA